MTGGRGPGLLFHHRWTVPVLAELHRSRGARFAMLVHRLGASAGAVRQTLDALLGSGWVTRNPGYGHPLRPEYFLTVEGGPVAAACLPLFERLRAQDLAEVGLRKWSLPVLLATGTGAVRYSRIRRSLPGITDRALARALRELEEAGLLVRRVLDEYPPATEYAATEQGEELLVLARAVVDAARRGAAG